MNLRHLLHTLAGCGLLLLATATATAATEIEVLDTWPRGNEVELAEGQNYYLRLRYRSDEPVGIWVRPMWDGQPASAGTSPSARYRGEGELTVWFFLMNRAARVNSIALQVGDGGRGDSVPLRLPVRVRPGTGSVSEPPPDWVLAAGGGRPPAISPGPGGPPKRGWKASDLLMLPVALLGMAILIGPGVLWPILALRRWKDGWRRAAWLPLALLGGWVLLILFDVARDPTSHNLWPFELVMADAIAIGLMIVITVLRFLQRRLSSPTER